MSQPIDFPFSSEPVQLPSYIGRNPVGGLDYLRQERALLPTSFSSGKGELVLRYVPDRYILKPGTFETILHETATQMDEASAHDPQIQLTWQVMHRLNDDLIARWIQVLLRVPVASASPEEKMDIAVLFEDRQPRWKNPALLVNLNGF